MIKKFNSNHLRRFCRTDCKIVLNQSELSENGGPQEAVSLSGKCRFVEKTKTVIDVNGKRINLIGLVVLVGDIAPELKKIADGVCIINGVTYDIYSARRPRNPDGSVHHTTLELM